MPRSRVCIVIPAYNEAASIGAVVKGVVAAGQDVLVVDDGSKDATTDEARGAGAVVLRHARNQGKGAAIRTAIAYVLEKGLPAALFMDADGQHLPDEIPLFLAKWDQEHPDLIVGSRMADNHEMPLVRRTSNSFSSMLVSAVAGTRVTDSQSGFRLLSERLLTYLRDRGGTGFDFETEMIIDAVRLGMKYAEVPISCVYGPAWKSHFHPVKDSSDFLGLVARKAVDVALRRIRES